MVFPGAEETHTCLTNLLKYYPGSSLSSVGT